MITSYQYDGFGRVTKVTSPTGSWVTTTYQWSYNSGGSLTYYPQKVYDVLTYTSRNLSGSPQKWDVYDAFGRKTVDEAKSYGDAGHRWVYTYTSTFYDARGNVIKTHLPCNGTDCGTEIEWIPNNYDGLNRMTSSVNSIGTTSYAYAYNAGKTTVTVTNPAGQVSSKTTDASGKVVSSKDYGGTLNFTYNGYGNQTCVKMTDPSNVTSTVSTMTYDNIGHQLTLTDQNSGTTNYAYDVLGRLKSQTDANAKTYSMTYDILDRLLTRVGPEGTTTNAYVASGAGLNKIQSVTSFNGITQQYSYDGFNRVFIVNETIDAINYVTGYNYNVFNEITHIGYTPSNLAIDNTYSPEGTLILTTSTANGVTTPIFDAGAGEINGLGKWKSYNLQSGINTKTISYNHFGMPTRYFYTGKQDLNLVWDLTNGNLTSREEKSAGTSSTRFENFYYDNLNRLTDAQLTNGLDFNVAYKANGNFDSKTQIGAYSYNSSHPNAVVSTYANTQTGASIVPQAQQSIIYTAFERPQQISEGSNVLTLTYASDYERRKTELKNGSTTVYTRYFLGDYEVDIRNGVKTYIHYIAGGDGLCAMAVKVGDAGTFNFYTVLTDHLGSILRVFNNAGTEDYQQNFDAWGRQRDPNNWYVYGTGSTTNPTWLYRGFTGHEHLNEFNLINMNARLYDPFLGRMCASDNFAGSGTQGLNRYTYAGNNPLNTIDPSGNEPITIAIIIGSLIGAYSGGAIANNGQSNPLKWDYSSGKTWGYIVGGGITGGISGGIGSAIGSSSIAFSNTLGIAFGSFFNSVGMNLVTGGQTPISLSFGFGSYNFTTGEFGFLGKSGNSFLENVGYGLGAAANLGDILGSLGNKSGDINGDVDLVTDHHQHNVDGSAKNGFEPFGHSDIVSKGSIDPSESIISYGADYPNGRTPLGAFNAQGNANWPTHAESVSKSWRTTIDNINISKLNRYAEGIRANPGRYSVISNSCVTKTSLGLWKMGIPNIGIHPYFLAANMALREVGFKPALFSYFFQK